MGVLPNLCIRIRRFLRIDKLPALLAILFALLGWTLTHTVSRITETPIIEYSVDEQKMDGSNKYHFTYVIRNISSNALIKGIEFDFQVPDKDKKRGGLLIDRKATAVIPMAKDLEEQEPSSENAPVIINKFHPYWEFTVAINTVNVPKLYLTYRTIYDDNTPIRLIQSNWLTFIICNEFKIMIVMVVFYALLIVAYLCCISSSNNLPNGEPH